MDDDEGVRDLGRSILEHLNYEVLVARDGDEAVAQYSRAWSEGEPFSIVVLDISVQGGKGGQRPFLFLKRSIRG